MQDAINANVVNGKHFSEKDIVRIFKGTCEAVRAMHDYHTTAGSPPQTSSSRMPAPSSSRPQPSNDHHSDDEEGDELLPHPEQDGEGGYSSVNVPLMTKRRVDNEGDVVFDGDEEVLKIQHLENGNTEPGKSEHVPYAHRDLKPG